MQQDQANALQLLDKILTHEVEALSKDEAEFLIGYKKVCSRKLLPILALEVSLIKDGESYDPLKLHGSLKLLAAFEEKKAFDSVIQLHEFPETLNGEEGLFIPLFWADILVATISDEWNKLMETIDNPEISDDIREACIDALLILVSQGRLDRALVIDHFQSLYAKAIAGEIYDPELLVFLIEASLSLWPGESIEEIKELFGLGLINEDLIRLPEILAAFEEGKEKCLAHLQSLTPHSHLLDFFLQESRNSEEISFEFEVDETPFEDETNSLRPQDKKIAYLLPSLEIKKLPAKEQKKYQSLPKLLAETPEKAIEIVSKMIDAHPDIPALFHYYHSALILLDAKVLAMDVVKEWVRRFPDDLLGKIEYAHYFLRKGEPQHVDEIFSDTWSLTALYPKRESFHELECLKFFHLLGLYLLQREEIDKAEEQLNILDTINPSSFEYHHLKRKLTFHLQGDFFVEDL